MSKTRKKSDARCQCMPGCPHEPLQGSPFCKRHSVSCPRKAPLSGYEPDYHPSKYNKYKGRKNSQNCFSYAFHQTALPKGCTKDSCNAPFHQPGIKSGYPKWSEVDGKRCPDLLGRLMGDVPALRMSTFTKRCPKGMTKAAVVTDADEDYHFYRQDSNAYWSHKPGSTDVTNRDATGRFIYDPQLATRKYSTSNLNYDNFCGYFCIPAKKRIKLQRAGSSQRKTKKRTLRK
jgi:hypothetical protein